VQDCNGQPAGYVDNDDDCDDTTDDITDGNTYYEDSDQDGFGNSAAPKRACSKPEGYVENGNDCDDNEASINPNGTEVCNGQDDDCNGVADDSVSESLLFTFYRDGDQDGYGDPNETEQACTPSEGYVDNKDDCDDTNPEVYIGAWCREDSTGADECESMINSEC